MKVGYRFWLQYDGLNEESGFSDYLIVDETLEEGLKAIQDRLRSWMENGGSEGLPDKPLQSFVMTVNGPYPEAICHRDRRPTDQRIAEAASPEERTSYLAGAAKGSCEAGRFEDARSYLAELQQALLNPPSNPNPDWWLEDAIIAVPIVLGRLALQEGRIEEAKRHLIEAGQSEGSPTMSSFGPNMSLARDLLLVGEKDAARDYFEACRKFWKLGADRLDAWTTDVNAGRMPDFGASLVY